MKSYTEYLTMNVPARMDFVNITSQVEQAVRTSGVREGLMLCNAMHITASVFINDDEPGLHEDFERWLERLAPEKTVVDRLDLLCSRSAGAQSLPGGVRAVHVGDRLVFCRGPVDRYSLPLKPGRVTRPGPVGFLFRCRLQEVTEAKPKRERRARQVFLDWDKLTPPLTVRNIRRGDSFVPLGMTGTKKVGDYLTDRKVPPVYRDEIPVVCDAEGIVWLVGFEIAERVKIDSLTRKVLGIEVTEAKRSQAAAV